jgi:hypothetical protein
MKKLAPGLLAWMILTGAAFAAQEQDIGPAPTVADLNEPSTQRTFEQLAEDAIDEMDGQTVMANHAYGCCNYEVQYVSHPQEATWHDKKCWVLVVDLWTTFALHPNTALKLRVYWLNGQRIGQYVVD